MKIHIALKYPSVLLFVLCFFLQSCNEKSTFKSTEISSIVPAPVHSSFSGETFELSRCTWRLEGEVNDFLRIAFYEYVKIQFKDSRQNCTDPIQILFNRDINLSPEHYTLDITDGSITITANDQLGFFYGIVSLAHLKDHNDRLPIGSVEDGPAYDYRALMVDLSRNWHSVNHLKELIALCGWYKIKYMQLHLTDDGLFTFPSQNFPELASQKHYSKADLEALNIFAKAHGVVLIPEIDMPGHSSGFIRTNPEKWGLKNVSVNPYTLNMGKEEVYQGIQALLTEVAAAFPDSPYLHIGGDEVYTAGFNEDLGVQAYMKEKGLKTTDDLYHHFIVRVAQQVKDLGRTPMVWSGFEKNSAVEIPKDIVVMAWNMAYEPRQLVKDGYRIINASWKPLYVVNNRKWSPKQIYDWTPYQWKGFDTPDILNGHVIDSSTSVLGGSMSAWEQGQYKEFSSLRKRLPAMSEKLWSEKRTSFENFKERLNTADKKLDHYLFPFSLEESGLTYGDWEDANRYENLWFEDSLKVKLNPRDSSTIYRYTLEPRTPTEDDEEFKGMLTISETTTMTIQGYTLNNKPVGRPLTKKYFLSPIKEQVSGLVNDLPPHSWENHKFTDSLVVKLSKGRPGVIRYTLDNTPPNSLSPIYTVPIVLKSSKTIQARLFDAQNNPIGIPWSEEYVLLGLEKSLTTDKPITTFNGQDEMGPISFINNGEIARWDHWGSHTNGNNWIVVDLEKEYEIDAFKTYTFWDDYRYYEYTISVSNNGSDWKQVVDRSKNRELSVPQGITDIISPTKARYVKLTLLRNSANPGLHLVEFQAFEHSKDGLL